MSPVASQRSVALSLAVVVLLLPVAPGLAVESRVEEPEVSDECLLRVIKGADYSLTVGELKALCGHKPERHKQKRKPPGEAGATLESEAAEPVVSAIDERYEEERETRENAFVITPHNPNYVLPLAYKIPNDEPYLSTGGEQNDKIEVKFQFSFKYLILANLLNRHGELYGAYTNQSYWQAYSSYSSSPFRETNHEPEVFFSLPNSWEFFGFTNKLLVFGTVHQSNGRSGELSRSWNRLYATIIFEKENFYFSVKPWLRIPEEAANDDNPDIHQYLGYGELRAFYKRGKQVFGLMFRNNLEIDENKGAIQLDWSFPLLDTERMKGYVQYFNGYGESLIDYNASTNRIGMGLLLTDWL